jgi:hypothetical protein
MSIYRSANGFLEVTCDTHDCPCEEANFIGDKTEEEMVKALFLYGWHRSNGGVWKCPRCREREKMKKS